ncbi:TetR/AcrR family transcriptional regulator [Paenibacillus alkaliterrae]|uniref:TetR/AcrR family transcriptional regulator n=1 Tax=Paenibacillus alkaliterrae TaxID=320909 RepID=UPI001F48E573|nr:TetR/AcrR family transcriptional regulator [Paenibacillus alkaliterrae]MCF2937980.1 TetR/AcrR family transcriptional regulator [Paenibacillus alkaliterrae]
MSKQKILAAALKLFSELGYYRTSMDDIAKEANVAKGTLYYHFTGKGRLFETLITEGIQMLMNEIKQVLEVDAAADKQIRAIVDKHVELFLRYSELIHILSNEISNGIEPDILGRFEVLKQQYIDFLVKIMQQGYKDGELNRLPFELAAAGMLGLIESVSVYYNKHKNRLSIDDLHETVNAFVTSTLLKSQQ